jgi:hypothetical protein
VLIILTCLVTGDGLTPFCTKRVTLYCPGPEKVWVGFETPDVLLAPEEGSPKSQAYEAPQLDELAAKLIELLLVQVNVKSDDTAGASPIQMSSMAKPS